MPLKHSEFLSTASLMAQTSVQYYTGFLGNCLRKTEAQVKELHRFQARELVVFLLEYPWVLS